MKFKELIKKQAATEYGGGCLPADVPAVQEDRRNAFYEGADVAKEFILAFCEENKERLAVSGTLGSLKFKEFVPLEVLKKYLND